MIFPFGRAESMAREFPNAEVIGIDLTLVPSDS